jgi:23S rRNA (uracil1939-C5)-methyltransferase
LTERLVITRIAHRGDGVAETPAGPLYVPYTLPGETVEVERVPGHPDRRHLLHVTMANPERITPICPHFGVCGGCAIQHWAPERYREWKRELVVNALRHVGLDAPVDDLIDAHGEGRRRATFHARRHSRDLLEVGFAALRAHQIVSIDRCPVLAPPLDGAIKAAWAISEELKPEKKPLDIQVTATDTGLDVDVRGSGALSPTRMQSLARIAAAQRLARLTRHAELVAQRSTPTLRVGPATVVLPPAAFLQATQAGEVALARLVLGHIGDVRAAADLFCGVGPFALRLAERARVSAADNDAAAIAALSQAARSTGGLKPVEAVVRDLYRRPWVAQEFRNFDAVVFDPPRPGAEALARELAKSKVPLVVAVSCNPATLARDARILVDGGYRLADVTPVDQFRYSAHVEIVARFEK